MLASAVSLCLSMASTGSSHTDRFGRVSSWSAAKAPSRVVGTGPSPSRRKLAPPWMLEDASMSDEDASMSDRP
eukprot:4217976-Prymnesium_polylepis.1